MTRDARLEKIFKQLRPLDVESDSAMFMLPIGDLKYMVKVLDLLIDTALQPDDEVYEK